MYKPDKHSLLLSFFLPSLSFFFFLISQRNSFTRLSIKALRHSSSPHLEDFFEILKSIEDWWLFYYSSCQLMCSKVTSAFLSTDEETLKKKRVFRQLSIHSKKKKKKDAPLNYFQLTSKELRNTKQLFLTRLLKLFRQLTPNESMVVRHLNILRTLF